MKQEIKCENFIYGDTVDFAKAYKLKLSGCNELDRDAHVVDAVLERMNEGRRLNLSSFDVKRELNPDVWVNGKLNSRVRLRLLDIADDFIDTLSTDWVKPKDILLLGSMAGYNWSRYSDFDVHVLIDFKKVDDRTEFVKDYFDTKKKEWNDSHDGLRIYGHPVEMYVQDTNEKCSASGVYSLEKNKWLKEPEKDAFLSAQLDKGKIAEKARAYMKQIDELESLSGKVDDDAQMRKVSSAVKKLWDRLKKGRKGDLERNGEMGTGNIVYKVLRRNGYMGKVFDLKTKTYDKIMSID